MKSPLAETRREFAMKLVRVGTFALALTTVSCRSKRPDGAPSPVSSAAPQPQTIRVAIGTQDTTINCATGGPLVRELHLLERYLPQRGKYAGVKYDIKWENQPTGAQLN